MNGAPGVVSEDGLLSMLRRPGRTGGSALGVQNDDSSAYHELTNIERHIDGMVIEVDNRSFFLCPRHDPFPSQ